MMSRIEKLRAYLEASPEDNFLRHALALEYIKTGEEDEARDLFEAILAHDPSYVGSYYHLAKLLERKTLFDEAITVYKNGMKEAEKMNDRHSYNELRAALEEIDDSVY